MEQPDETCATRFHQDGQARTASGWLQAGIFLTILFAYLVGEGRTLPYIDSKQVYDVAESIVYRGSVKIPVGGGFSYATHPFLPSAIHVPGAALRYAIARNNPELDKIVKPITSHFGSEVMAALGCLVFFRLLLYLGVTAAAASLGTLVLAFGTLLPIYARTAWSEACQATCFIGFYAALLRLRGAPARRTGLWFGLWTGMLVNSKYLFALVLPGALLFLAYEAWRRRKVRLFLVGSLWSIPTGAIFLALMVWYNWARTGDSSSTGYPTISGLVASVFRENILFGLWSQFFSLGKNIFFYSPPLVLAVLALPHTARTRAAALWALVLTAGPVLCLYGKFVYWSGDWCWGPRYLLFLIPALMVFATLYLDQSLRARRRLLLAAWGGIFLVGAWVQLAGASQYWDHFIRVSKSVQTEWLGGPNRKGAYVPEMHGQCDPCFEDFYARTYTPAFQPIEAHSWFLWHHLKSDPWQVAAQDMPLKRYTSLDFSSVQRWYEQSPWDWWKLSFVGRYRKTGNLLLAILVIGLCGGVVLWGRGLWDHGAPKRTSRDKPSPQPGPAGDAN
jgi:hypothetical protein